MAEKDLLVSPQVTLRFSSPQRVDIDGEVQPRARARYTLTVAPAALNVLTPRSRTPL